MGTATALGVDIHLDLPIAPEEEGLLVPEPSLTLELILSLQVVLSKSQQNVKNCTITEKVKEKFTQPFFLTILIRMSRLINLNVRSRSDLTRELSFFHNEIFQTFFSTFSFAKNRKRKLQP